MSKKDQTTSSVESRLPQPIKLPRTRPPGAHETACNPAEFDKKTTPVRERMARELQEMPPEERIKRGR